MKRFTYSLLISLSILSGCTKSNNTPVTPVQPVNPTPTPPPTTLLTLPAGWKLSTLLTASFPSGIQLYFFDTLYLGKKTKAFCLAYDSKKTNFEFKPVLAAAAKKPSDYFKEEPGVVYACINGGFYGGNQSYSMVQYNNTVLSANIKSVSRALNGVNTAYYPTRAAFGMNTAGEPVSAWIYHVGAGLNDVYSYPAPSPNAEGSAPQIEPTTLFPAGGSRWVTTAAIGGSPMLIRNGTIQISDVAELININNTISRPRSAIGANSSGLVIVLAVEGDNTSAGYVGMNLAELAAMLKDLSCTNAINLDGGGSTSMVVGNQLLVRPGDNGVERPVVSAVVIKQK